MSQAVLERPADRPASGDRVDWANRIAGAWRRVVQDVFETGRLLAEARSALSPSEWTAMVAKDLPFSLRMAQYLIHVATDERLRDPEIAARLPPNWTTLYQLTRLDDAAFGQALESGAIHPAMEKTDALRLLTAGETPKRVEPKVSRVTLAGVFTPFGKPLSQCDKGELEAALARLPETERLLRALIARMPAVGHVGKYVDEVEGRALVRQARAGEGDS